MKKSYTKLTPATVPVTSWTLIGKAGVEGELGRQALETVIVLYGPVLRTFLVRRFGLSSPDAEDVQQGFIADRILERELLARADKNRGKFRTYLFTSLENYAIDALRKRKREAGINQRLETGVQESEASGTDPRRAIDAEWAKRVINLSLERMKLACDQTMQPHLWIIFKARVIEPAWEGTSRSYSELLLEAGFKTPVEAANALVTAKRRYEKILADLVGEYVDDPKDVDAEVTDLLRALESGR